MVYTDIKDSKGNPFYWGAAGVTCITQDQQCTIDQNMPNPKIIWRHTVGPVYFGISFNTVSSKPDGSGITVEYEAYLYYNYGESSTKFGYSMHAAVNENRNIWLAYYGSGWNNKQENDIVFFTANESSAAIVDRSYVYKTVSGTINLNTGQTLKIQIACQANSNPSSTQYCANQYNDTVIPTSGNYPTQDVVGGTYNIYGSIMHIGAGAFYTPPSNLSVSINSVTGKSINASANWTKGTKNCILHYRLLYGSNYATKSAYANANSTAVANYVEFTAKNKDFKVNNTVLSDSSSNRILDNGKNYKIQCYLTDGTTDSSGNLVKYCESLTNATTSAVTTLKVTLTNKGKSTKKIKFQATMSGTGISNKYLIFTTSYQLNGAGILVGSDNGGSNITISNPNGTPYSKLPIINTVTNLPHNKDICVTACVNGIIGSEGINDTYEELIIKTKLLTLINTSYTQHQFSIISLWQAKADGVNCSHSAIDTSGANNDYIEANDDIKFVLAKCTFAADTTARNYIPDSTKPNDKYKYKTADSDKKSGTCTGNYQTNKTLTASGLDYWCWYIITCTITDGCNEVSATLITHTIFPYSRIHNNGWKKAMPFVFSNGKWQLAPAFVFNGSAFKVCNGE